MSQEMDNIILRKSLDEVDRVQKWQVAGLLFFLALFLFQTLTLLVTLNRTRLASVGSLPPQALVGLGMCLMFFTVMFCTFGITYFISRMTKRILKAIEFSSRP